jgi:hypothetical protein
VALLALGAACGRETTAPRTLRALLVRPPHDTVRFAARASAHRCARGRGILVLGVRGGNGALLWVRSRDSLDGDYPLLARGDSTTVSGAMVSLRFMVGTDARGVTLDSGAVTLTRLLGAVAARVEGSGLDPVSGVRVGVRLRLVAAPLDPDTVSCDIRL